MANPTTNLSIPLPVPDVSTDWGNTLNAAFQLIDNLFAGNGTGTSVGINVGSGKTAMLGGTIVLGRGDNTDTAVGSTLRGPRKTGTDVTGPNISINAANGTGTGGSGNIYFQTAPASTTPGTAANTMRIVMTIDNDGNIRANVGQFVNASGAPISSTVAGINAQTVTAYTVGLSDAGKLIEMNNAAANTVTIPPNSSVAFPIGTIINVTATGAGQTTLVAGSGVTLRSYGNKLKLTGQYSQAVLIKRSTDIWAVAGDLIA